MKKVNANEAFQSLSKSIGIQIRGIADTDLIGGSISKAKYTLIKFTPLPDAAKTWIEFYNMDPNQPMCGQVDTTDTITVEEEVYYKVKKLSETFALEGQVAVSKSEWDSESQATKIYVIDGTSVQEVELVEGYADSEEVEGIVYPYELTNSGYFCNEEILGEGVEEYIVKVGTDVTTAKNEEGFYLVNTTESVTGTISGEKTTSDWEGKLAFYVETTVGGEDYYGKIYVDSILDEGDIYCVKGDEESNIGEQDIVEGTVTDADIYWSVDGEHFFKKADVAGNMTIISDIPFGIYWKVVYEGEGLLDICVDK